LNAFMRIKAAPYLLIGLVGATIYFFFPAQLPLASRIATLAIFVMSLDLVVGYGGLATLGHSALFGTGAYTAGLLALHSTPNPLLGLLVGGASSATVAALSGLFVLRYQGLTFLMLTIAVGQIIQNIASKFRAWTGGDDGLSGFTTAKILGLATFDLQGRVAFLYCTGVLLICLWMMRRLMGSAFGLACIGIHQNRLRMAALGTEIQPKLLTLYGFSGWFAGIAGALSAQVNQIVGLDTLGFELSAEALVMLVLGGAGSLFGAIAGTALFTTIHHVASNVDPYHWLFVIGAMLVCGVLIPRERWGALMRARP